jgi:hypothetical protein
MMPNAYQVFSKIVLAAITALSLSACGGGQVTNLPEEPPAPPVVPKLHLEFNVDQSRNNQGLAYSSGFYYIGYDLGGGNGYIERYNTQGVLDPDYGRVSIPTRHTAEIAFRSSDGRIYAASGGGTEPTYVYKIASNGKAVEQVYDLKNFGNSALLAFDNDNDLLLLSSTQSGGDLGPVTFRFIDLKTAENKVVSQFTLPSLGVPQGLEYFDGRIYYYTNNKITVLDQSGTVLDEWQLQAAGESEGLTIVQDATGTYLAVGYNAARRIYSIRPIQLGKNAPLQRHYVISEN